MPRPSWTLHEDQLGDLELLLSGALAPLDGYASGRDETAVAETGRLAEGRPCPLTVALFVAADATCPPPAPGETVVLRDPEHSPLALLHLDTVETSAGQAGGLRVAGRLEPLAPREHHDFPDLRRRPPASSARPGATVAGVWVDWVIDGALASQLRACRRQADALVVLVPVTEAAATTPQHYARVRAILRAASDLGGAEPVVVPDDVPPGTGPAGRWLRRLVIAHNYGITDLQVTREQADAAREAAAQLDGRRVSARPAVHALPPLDWDEDARACRPAAGPPRPALPLEHLVATGGPVPPWLLDEGTVTLLRRAWRRVAEPGVTVFMTGLSGAGKSTIARALRARVLDRAARPVTLLDGDLVRRLLSAGLGYSREEREQNILRIGFVAAEVTRHGGLAICAAIAPHDRARQRVRDMVSAVGGFVLVHVDTPLDVCEARDRKGLYERARQGEVAAFTGVSDAYEPPGDAALRIDTTRETAGAAADRIFAHLVEHGFVRDTTTPASP